MKQTKKEIEETVKNKIHRQYKDKMESYQERIDHLAKELHDERVKRREYQNQVEELKEKVEQYEDWNRRLQEFMDMSEEDRKHELEKYRVSQELNGVLDMYKHFMGLLMI